MVRSLLPILALASACTASAVEVAPPRYDLYFPTGLAMSPDERFLFIVNANSDLRYSHGTLQVFDLDKVDELATAWAGNDSKGDLGCEPETARPKVLGCPLTLANGDASPVVVKDAAVGIGNFGVGIGVQPLEQGGAPSPILRVFTTVRGDPSVTWGNFDTSTGKMTCGAAGGFPRCDQDHRLARWRNDTDLPVLTAEPFNLFVDPLGEHVYVTHFTTGFVTLISAPAEVDSPPLIQHTITTLFAPNQNGRLGAAGVAVRLPGEPGGLAYVTSRDEARISTIAVTDGPVDNEGRPTELLVRSTSFLLAGLEQAGLNGDARGITFSKDGNRAYVITRTPPALQVFDTSLGPTGAPRNDWMGAVEVCEQPANLGVADFGAGTRVAVPCFQTGQIWLLDPVTLRLVATENSGRGPSGVVASAKHKKIYVGNYAEDTITVVDAAPGSATQNRVVLRLGKARLGGE